MDSLGILECVEEMEKILGHPADTEEARDNIISNIAERVKKLQCVLQSNSTNLECAISGDEKKMNDNNEFHSCQTKEVSVKWKICNCGEAHCLTCHAEREAQKSALAWMSQHGDVKDPEVTFRDLTSAYDECIIQSYKDELAEKLGENDASVVTTVHYDAQMVTTDNRPDEETCPVCGMDREDTQHADDTEWYGYSYDQDVEMFDNEIDDDILDIDPDEYDDLKDIQCDDKELEDFQSDIDQTCDQARPTTSGRYGLSSGQRSMQQTHRPTLQQFGQPGTSIQFSLRGNLPMTFQMRFTPLTPVRQHESLNQVWCVTEQSSANSGINVARALLLHPRFSVSDLLGYGTPNACGVAVLMLANATRNTSIMEIVVTRDGKDFLQYDLYRIMSCNIAVAIDRYTVNCASSTQCLGVHDLFILNSDLGIDLIEEKQVQSSVIETFADALMRLKADQILLLVRMDDYNVISAACGVANKDIVMYDSLARVVRDPVTQKDKKHGGVIYPVDVKDEDSIRRTLSQLEIYSGEMKGACTIALFQTSEGNERL